MAPHRETIGGRFVKEDYAKLHEDTVVEEDNSKVIKLQGQVKRLKTQLDKVTAQRDEAFKIIIRVIDNAEEVLDQIVRETK